MSQTIKISNNRSSENPDIIPAGTRSDSTTQSGFVQHVNVVGGSASDNLASYHISDLDEAAATKYYGNVDKDGNWYILQLTSTAARYAKGAASYTTNWTGRAGLSYDYFYNVF